MTHQEAVHLISNLKIDNNSPQTWLDLGCGSGTFTLALASLLPSGSRVIGIDNQFQKLRTTNNVSIEFLQANMNEPLEFPFSIHGIMMANSLHYIQSQKAFLKKLASLMNNSGQFIIIEYDTNQANTWVPYPIRFKDLATLFDNVNIQKIGERVAAYNGEMYAAQVVYNSEI